MRKVRVKRTLRGDRGATYGPTEKHRPQQTSGECHCIPGGRTCWVESCIFLRAICLACVSLVKLAWLEETDVPAAL
ncbi:hypothetical protein Pmani_017914 [Petrolisthes manimaculis]|uniref:Uncharacterized protein n=1 Tax=Petrolisthes manimaculis TaxID=1843537 RepID=A0AAE1PM06_9EUCA|nr:hypothetical protein Pmani_017914 [Petrolisthes manimaculis]